MGILALWPDLRAAASFSKSTPSISKFIAWNLQAFPNISFAVLSVFKGLRGAQGRISNLQIFSPSKALLRTSQNGGFVSREAKTKPKRNEIASPAKSRVLLSR
jgi:hypothetical protein